MAKAKNKKSRWVVDCRHNSTAYPNYYARESYDDAVKVAHKFFLSYGFCLIDGKAFDDGNDDGVSGGYDCFYDVKIHNGKVAEFVHCDGEGPVCSISESK